MFRMFEATKVLADAYCSKCHSIFVLLLTKIVGISPIIITKTIIKVFYIFIFVLQMFKYSAQPTRRNIMSLLILAKAFALAFWPLGC